MPYPLAAHFPLAERTDASATTPGSPRAEARLDASWSRLADVLEVAPPSRLRAAPRRVLLPGEVPATHARARIGGMLALLLASLWFGLNAGALIAWLPLLLVAIAWMTWVAGDHQVREVLNDSDRPPAEQTRAWRGEVDVDAR